MKILLIATLRSGGYNLGSWISKELGYYYSHEPLREYRCGDNEVVKHLINNVIERHGDREYEDIDTKCYDKVITLHRKDVRKAAESFTIAETTNNYHNKYEVNLNLLREYEDKVKENQIFLNRCNDDISKITYSELNLTYEGIYESGEEIEILKEYLGIINPKYQFMLDRKYKLRRELI